MVAPTSRTILMLEGRGRTRGARFYTDAEGYDAIWKDPDSIEDLSIDWSRELGANTLSTSTWATVDNVTIDSETENTTTGVVTVIISGDPSTMSELVNTIVDSAGLKFQRTIRIYGREH